MIWMMVVACSWFQVLIVLRVDKEDISTDPETEVIWLLVRPPLALPRVLNVSAVMVLMLDARAADTCGKKYISYQKI